MKFSGFFVFNMKDINIIVQNEAIKTAFGSYAILDKFEVWEHPAIYQFAKIVSNYMKMQKKLDEINKSDKI